MTKPGYAVHEEPAMDAECDRPVVVLRHQLPPHDVVERLSFPTTDQMRTVALMMISEANKMDGLTGRPKQVTPAYHRFAAAWGELPSIAPHVEEAPGFTTGSVLGAMAQDADEIARLRLALADAIRRPMGVIPASAEGLLAQAEIDAAEARRPAHQDR